MTTLAEHPQLIIFDLDGTLRRTTVAGKPCPHAPGEWELLPKVKETVLRIAREHPDIRFGTASNQDQVAYGWLTEQMARRLIEDVFAEAIGLDGATITIRFCPHAMDAGCRCRKPAPGMLLDVMRTCDIAPEATLFVGDAPMDREAAQAAGVSFAWAREFFDRQD